MRSVVIILIILAALTSCVVPSRDNPIDQKGNNFNPDIGKIPPADRWLTKTDMQIPRQGHGSASVNGRIYVFGGFTNAGETNITNSVEEFNTAKNTWISKTVMPFYRARHTTTEVNSEIYLIGGTDGTVSSPRIDEYDPITDTWIRKTDYVAKDSHSAVEYNGKIYIVGGIISGNISSRVDEYNPVTDSWTVKADMPTARSLVGLSVIDDKIYAVGGYDNSGPSKKIEVYLPGTDTWITKRDYPTGLDVHQTTSVNGKIYSMIENSVDVLEYDYVKDLWNSRTNRPISLSNFSITEVNGKIYAIGGIAGNSVTGSIDEYTPPPAGSNADTWSELAPMPTIKAVPGVVALNGKIYVFNGWDTYTDPQNVLLYSFEIYDPVQNKWSSKPTMQFPGAAFATAVINGKIYAISWSILCIYDPVTDLWERKNHPFPYVNNWYAGVSLYGKLYVIGGWDGSDNVFSTVLVYDPITDTWTNKTPMPTPRFALTALAVNGKIYAIGGRSSDTAVTYIVEEYDPINDTWTRKSNLPFARGFFAGALINGKIYIIGGVSNNETYIDTVHEYNPVTDTWSTKKSLSEPRGFLSSTTAVVNGKIYVVGGEVWSDSKKTIHATTNKVEVYISPNNY